MEFQKFIDKLPEEETIRLVNPPVYDELLSLLIEGLGLGDVPLGLKRIRANGVHLKLMKVINCESSINDPSPDVLESISVCKRLLKFLIYWINTLEVLYSMDYVPILSDIYSELSTVIILPNARLTFHDFTKSLIHRTLVRLLESFRQNLNEESIKIHASHYNPAIDCQDSLTHRIFCILHLVGPPFFLQSSQVSSKLTGILSEIPLKTSPPNIPLEFYKLLHLLAVGTQNIDEFKALLLSDSEKFQMSLLVYISDWLNEETTPYVFCHDWIFEYLYLLESQFRHDLARLFFPPMDNGKDPFTLRISHRDSLLADSYTNLMNTPMEELAHGMIVHIPIEAQNVMAYGAGVTREWFSIIGEELARKILEIRNEEAPKEFYLAKLDNSDQDSFRYYKFFGKLLAIALTYREQLGVSLSKCFHVVLADEDIKIDDIKVADAQFYDGLMTGLKFDFDNFWDMFGMDEDMEESSCNRIECIEKYIRRAYVDSLKAEIDSFKEGIDEVLGSSFRRIFFKLLDFRSLQPMLCGITELSVDEWKDHTEYGEPYTADTIAILDFWEIVKAMTPEEKMSLFTFWTSHRGLPIGGFMRMPRTLLIVETRDESAIDKLPVARTCNLQLCLPRYSSTERMRTCLMTVATTDYICMSFGFV